MKRCLLVVTVLYAWTVSLAHADYVKIMINVGGSPDAKKTPAPTPPAGGGGGDIGLGLGGTGGAGTGGAVGIGGAGPSRLPGIGGPGAGPGIGGSPDEGGRGAGNPGGGGQGLGELGGRGGGAVGIGGPGVGGTGTGTSEGQNIGNLGEGLMPGDTLDSRAIWVEAVIEFEAKDGRKAQQGVPMYLVKHKFGPGGQAGQTWLPIPLPPAPGAKVVHQGPITAFIHPEYRLFHIKGPTVAQRYESKQKDLTKNKQDKNPAALVNLAQWCLEHGLVNEVPKIMEKAAKADPKNATVVAFQKTEEALRRAPRNADDAELWRERLSGFKLLDDPAPWHYRVLYEETESTAKKLNARLETNFRAFYYWWALKGHVMPVPERQLLAILFNSQKDFDYQHREIFESAPMAADGFLARRDNIAIISAIRLDPAYEALARFARPLQLPYVRKDLLSAKGFKWPERNPMETSYAQMLTLLQEALQEESELMTATHEGTRQLIAAVGLLPHNVMAPLWIDSGMGSFFETPRGAFWPGTGAPNWAHLGTWKQMEKDKKLDQPPTALKAVVTDRYFRDAAELLAKEKEERDSPAKDRPAAESEREKDRDTSEKAMARARALSWGLTYFAMQQHRPKLMAYYQELQRLPRDLQLDDDALWLAFCRAFDLMAAGKADAVDESKVFRFGSQWQQYIKLTPLPAAELQKDITKDKDAQTIGG